MHRLPRIVSVVPSQNPRKKWAATFSDGAVILFGDPQYEDYLSHKDSVRKRLYQSRFDRLLRDMQSKSKAAAFIKTPAFLAYHVTWSKSTLRASIRHANEMIRSLETA